MNQAPDLCWAVPGTYVSKRMKERHRKKSSEQQNRPLSLTLSRQEEELKLHMRKVSGVEPRPGRRLQAPSSCL